MKRLYILLLLTLLLAGCNANDPEITTQQTTVEETQEPTVPGLYLPNSTLEQSTNGAVRVYPLEEEYAWIGNLGADLMLGSDGENARIYILSGDNCVPKQENIINGLQLCSKETAYARITGGLAFHHKETNQVRYYNSALVKTNSLDLPEDISGNVGILVGSGKIYYCVGTEIFETDPSTGINRMVRRFSAAQVVIVNSYCDGQVLRCLITDEAGQSNFVFISTQTGQNLGIDPGLQHLYTYGSDFFATFQDGAVQLQLFGNGETVSQLNVPQGGGFFHGALAMNGVVHAGLNESGVCVLNFYDLSTGLRTDSVALENMDQPTAFYADGAKGCIWFLAKEHNSDNQMLCRWAVSSGTTGDETVYTGPYFTENAPDAEGLAQCQQRVDELNSKYFTRIYIWQDAVEKTQEYTAAGEYQVSVINSMLDVLDATMAQFPDDFMWDSADGTDSNRLRICLVRALADGSSGKQYWYNGECYILIASDADTQWEFIKGLSYAVVSHTLGNAVELDAWTHYNPSDFIYGQKDSQYILDEERYFVDMHAMASLTDDRSLTFAFAVMPENAYLFQSSCMQYKLKQLCVGIRKAYRLTRYEQVLPWEQYLSESLAYIPDGN